MDHPGEIGLIVDIGGGTSDYSLFRAGNDDVTILANHGVRIGGTDFDRAINIDCIMPFLGKGTQLKKMYGTGTTPTPVAIFNDLATWEKIPFLYTPQNRGLVKEMLQLSTDREKLQRLLKVLNDELGHDLAFAAERGKILANSGDADSKIALDRVEHGLEIPLTMHQLDRILARYADQLKAGALQTIGMADLQPGQVNRIVYVGGSSLMSIVKSTMRSVFPDAQHVFSEVFTAVTDGLAISAGRQIG